jgi:hypothetical protein
VATVRIAIKRAEFVAVNQRRVISDISAQIVNKFDFARASSAGQEEKLENWKT